ncbi:NosD domain-containing protein [Methanosarcina barkeri]|uniref:NosD domain-containing protein n=1 Tax=Methanosarcina barkeri TaxID=2208 RepID=UPI00373FC9B1
MRILELGYIKEPDQQHTHQFQKNKITGCNVGIEFYHESSSPGIYNNYFSNKNNIIFDSSWNAL